ncbi:MAG: hypothetical protein Ct9H300mP1_24970 [Planctomycetaceae bacterium]|nr:MAG: hypothetical protein Ct9H300mP1_24970 [Planctomycetaceae bacterium]
MITAEAAALLSRLAEPEVEISELPMERYSELRRW